MYELRRTANYFAVVFQMSLSVRLQSIATRGQQREENVEKE